MLAASGEERSELLDTRKGLLDVRSRLVHGGSLRTKQAELLAAVGRLRAMVRRSLRTCVLLAVDESSPFDRQFFASELDSTLVNGSKREELRRALGLA